MSKPIALFLTVPPNKKLFGGTVPPNKILFGGTVPPSKKLFGGTIPVLKCHKILILIKLQLMGLENVPV